MSPLILALAAGAGFLVLRGTKKKTKQPTQEERKRGKVAATILEEMPTQFWPEWHESAASTLVQLYGVSPDHPSVVALLGMAKSLREMAAPDYAATIGRMVEMRRAAKKLLFWPRVFDNNNLGYFVCQNGDLHAGPGQCVLLVPLPKEPDHILTVTI